MEKEILTELVKYGGGTAIIVALIFFLKTLKEFIYKKNGNNQIKRIEDLEKKIGNEYSHELIDIRQDINELWKETRKNSESIAWIKAKINGRDK